MLTTPEVADRATTMLATGAASWLVVGGKMCSGKDTVAPAWPASAWAHAPS